jgi:DNA mismatch endonuclease (patch repair protein)
VRRDIRNRSELLQQGWRVFELWECGIRKPEAEMEWLLAAVPDFNQQYISWPAFPSVPFS